uniref:Uncharacterized protein n=1 Tax=Sphaerodactylus townsendi TaxID=933632 RepID=A0ACB8F0Y7_9SAUR
MFCLLGISLEPVLASEASIPFSPCQTCSGVSSNLIKETIWSNIHDSPTAKEQQAFLQPSGLSRNTATRCHPSTHTPLLADPDNLLQELAAASCRFTTVVPCFFDILNSVLVSVVVSNKVLVMK